MNSASPLENREDLERLFDEVGAELTRLGAVAEIVMVGGSWLLWHTDRASTRDVDSARLVDAPLKDAVRRVAGRHDLDADWLNDHAASFWPADATYADCTVAYTTGGLTVKVPAPEVIFVMKLYRAMPQDVEDMAALWPRCGFADPASAVAAYWRAYPHAPDDPWLESLVVEIAQRAGV